MWQSVEKIQNLAIQSAKSAPFTHLIVVSILFALTISGSFSARSSKYFIGVYSEFWLMLLAIILLVAVPTIGNRLANWLNTLAEFLHRRGSFRSDPLSEAPKFAMLRVLFGLFLIERAVWILVYMFPADWSQPKLVIIIIASLVAGIMVTIGIFTQASLAYLLLFQWQVGDGVMGTSTLGNDIGAIFALFLIVANAGAHYSVDGYVRKRDNLFARIIALSYFRSGLPQVNTLQIAKIMALTSYWCVCVYSLMMHLGESAWMNGSAGPLLLTSSFMSQYYTEFQEFFQLGSFAVTLGKFSLWAMLPWYLAVLPFVLLGGLWRAYVIIWGVLFFGVSLFVLQLGWLAQFELLLFAGLFWQSVFMSPRGSLHIAYDDRCNLCDRTINLVKFLDIFGRVDLKPVSKNATWLKKRNIIPEQALADLYGIESNLGDRISHGYDFYLTLSRSIFLLLPAYPILLIGKWVGLGPNIYRYMADRRVKLFGVCEIPSLKPEAAIEAEETGVETKIVRSDPIVPIAVHGFTLALIYLLFMPIPLLEWTGLPVPSALEKTKRYAKGAAHVYGIAPINVFNREDLRLAENWFTIESISTDGGTYLLPILRADGSRLPMHNSDRVYFGHTLRFRRGKIGKLGCFFKKDFKMIKKFAQFHDLYKQVPSKKFRYTQYHQALPDTDDIIAGKFAIEMIKQVCVEQFNVADISRNKARK